MLDAPRQDWQLYDDRTRQTDIERVRRLGPGERFAIYADLFNMIWQARQSARFSDRLEERRWQQKLEVRQRAVNAYAQLDERRRERTASEHAD